MKAIKALIMVFLLAGPGFSIQALADNVEREYEQGKILMKSGDFKKSAELFNHLLTQKKDAIKNHPLHADSWYLFSVSLRKLGRTDLADKALDRAKKLKEATAKEKAHHTEPETHVASGSSEPGTDDSNTNEAKTEEASATVEVAKEPAAATNDANAYNLASLKNEKAQEYHRKGCAFQEAGQWQAAADEFLQAAAAEPGNVELLEKTAIILDQIGGSYYQKGQTVFGELEKVAGGKMTSKLKAAQARANIFSAKPDFAKAETLLKAMLGENAENIEALILSAQLDSENKKFKEAIEKFEKVIKLDKSSMIAYLGLGESYQKMNQFPKAIEVLQQARALWPDNFMPLVSLGNAYLKNGDNGFALVMFNLAYAMNQESFDVNLGLLEIFARKGDYRSATHISRCEKVLRGDPRVEFWKATFMELDERTDEARKIYSVLAMYQDDIAYRARLRLGQLYAGIGHETFPGNLLVVDRPEFLRLYKSMFNQELAFTYLQEFLEKKADSPEAKSAKQWLDENEEAVRSAREFDAFVQSQFSSN